MNEMNERPLGREGVGKREFPVEEGLGKPRVSQESSWADMDKWKIWDRAAQVCLILFTMLGFFLTAIKLPQYGLVAALISQIFWFYSSYKAWKEANQIGIFISTIFIFLIVLYGVINYWFW